ncbi:MAG: restriction endonuclease subunit S [Flavobacterium sp. BFFFF2]|nr:MAG: restriction endonuclease subunit S [Flavobacterium sp. BFFFF2]
MSLDIEKIGDVCNVGDGAHASIKRTLNGIPYYTSKNFKIEGIDLSKVDYISEEDFKKHFRSNSNAITKPIKDDILLSIIGSIGAPHLVKDEDDFGLSSSVSILRPNVSKIEPQFLYYWIKSDDFQNAVHQIKSGVAQSFLSLSMIKQLPVIYPKSLETQKRIASILSNYDDLIENNLKRIKLLEETAQNIYKEWFVNFRFPNYEHTAFDAESGLPVGWEMKKMIELMNISGGGTPSTKIPNYWDGEVIWFSPTDLGKNSSLMLLDSSKKITREGLAKSSAKLLPPMTILMSSRATIGLFGMINKECSTNQGFINIIPNEIFYRYYILQNLIGRKNEIIGKATGTTFKEISKGVFNTMTIMKPKSDVVKLYFDFADSIFKQIEIIEIQNQKLKEARDILLPRLMNRTIEV